MKAYITCPITQSQERLSLLPEIETIAKSEGLDTFVFIAGGTAEEIFERDFNNVKTSDLLIAEVSEPSHGVGIEIGLSYMLGLKRILLIQENKRLSKLAEGIPDTTIIAYNGIDDMKDKLKKVLQNRV